MKQQGAVKSSKRKRRVVLNVPISAEQFEGLRAGVQILERSVEELAEEAIDWFLYTLPYAINEATERASRGKKSANMSVGALELSLAHRVTGYVPGPICPECAFSGRRCHWDKELVRKVKRLHQQGKLA